MNEALSEHYSLAEASQRNALDAARNSFHVIVMGPREEGRTRAIYSGLTLTY